MQAIFAFYGAWWGYSYYTGRVGFSGHAEEIRKDRVKKFGWLLIIGIVMCLLGGGVLFLYKLSELIMLLI